MSVRLFEINLHCFVLHFGYDFCFRSAGERGMGVVSRTNPNNGILYLNFVSNESVVMSTHLQLPVTFDSFKPIISYLKWTN